MDKMIFARSPRKLLQHGMRRFRRISSRRMAFGMLGSALAVLALFWYTTGLSDAIAEGPGPITMAPTVTAALMPVVHEQGLAGSYGPPAAHAKPERAAAPVDAFDMLVERAQSGDSLAACELASKILRCQEWSATHKYIPVLLENLAADPDVQAENYDQIAGALAADMDWLDGMEPVCGGLAAEDLDRAYEFHVLSAESGTSDDRVSFVLDPALSIENFVNDLDNWQDYRDRAKVYLTQAMQAGNTDALLYLALLHSPHQELHNFGIGPVALSSPEPSRAVLYFSAYQEHLGLLLDERASAAYEAALDMLPPLQIDQLRAQAGRLTADHFTNTSIIPDRDHVAAEHVLRGSVDDGNDASHSEFADDGPRRSRRELGCAVMHKLGDGRSE